MPEIVNMNTLFADPEHYTEIRAMINGVAQTVINCEITGGLSQGANVGGTESRQLDLDILPAGTVDAENPVLISVRLSSKDGNLKSEWIPKGTYWIDTCPISAETGVMSIHGFDAMMKMEQDMLDDEETDESWPQTPSAVMNRIAAAIGVPLDERTVLNDSFLVPYPSENSLRESAGETSGPPYILNLNTKIIHRATCRRVPTIAPESLESTEETIANLKTSGYRVCRVCRPTDSDTDDAPDDSASLSMRTVAGYISAMQGGNWTITDRNTLYLVPFEIFHSSIHLLGADSGRAILFGNAVILV